MLSGLSGYIKSVKNAVHSSISTTQQKPTLGRIRVGNRDLEEVKLIAQGGYAYVFKVRDCQTGELFALKKMICQSPERLQTAKNELNMLRSLPNHPNLLRVYDTSVERIENCYYVYVVLELCDDGSVFDLMAKYEATKLTEKQIIFIMREICEGVKVLHSMKPPIAHRDLKIENVLMNNKKFKLCDFGSCSSSVVDFAKVPQSQYSTYEEEYDKNCTLMYRPPEMCDPFLRQVVSTKVDIWMLGCIMFTMCYYKHPFQEMTKLSIVNAAYTFPSGFSYPDKMIDLIRIMLTPNPQHRPSIFEICDLLNNYFEISSIQLNPDAMRIKKEQQKQAAEMKKFESANSSLPKYQGDIPIEELMRLQKSVQRNDDSSPINNYTEPVDQPRLKPNRHSHSGSKPLKTANFDDFDSFGGSAPPRKSMGLEKFNSSPGLQQPSNNDWHSFSSSDNTAQHNKLAQKSAFSQFAPTKGPEPVQTSSKVNDQWSNFNFNSVSSTPNTNNNTNNNNAGNNSWATSGWGSTNQTQTQQQPAPAQGNINQNAPNGWGGPNQGQVVNNRPVQMQVNTNQMPPQNNWGMQQTPSNNGPMRMHGNMNQMVPQNNWGMQQTPSNNRPMQMQGNMNQVPQNNWGMQNPMQQQQQRMGQVQGNMGQNNGFGGFNSNNGGQPMVNNNNMGGQKPSGGTTVTNDLLDLADTSKKDASSSIMALYSMKI